MSSLLAVSSWHSDVPTWILLAVGLLVAWRVTRGGGGAAVTELSAANAVLERRVKELESQVDELKRENGALAVRTDFATALAAALHPILTAVEAQTETLDTIAARINTATTGGV